MRVRGWFAFRHNRILRYHLLRGLMFWAVIEGVGLCAVRLGRSEFINPMLKHATLHGIQFRLPPLSLILMDSMLAVLAATTYTLASLRRQEALILLGNLGIGRLRLATTIGACGLLVASTTWCLR